MDYANIIFTVEDGIATIKLNRPKALNALNSEINADIMAAINEVKANPEIRVLIVTGSERAFAAGADVKEMAEATPRYAREFCGLAIDINNELESLPIPTIAAVGGFAFGGGCEMTLACDFRVGGSRTMLSFPEVGLGIIPGANGCARATAIVGPAKAKQLVMLTEMIPGKLYQLGDPDKEPVVKGVKLDGNQIGSTLNDREPADDNIRFVFALGEWVYVYPDTEKKSGLSVYVTEHQKDAETITDSFLAALSDDTPKAELIAPEEDGSEWGAFYLHQETFAAGNYDLIFADGLKPVARVLLKFYPESELNEKNDAELEAIMSDARKAASGS